MALSKTFNFKEVEPKISNIWLEKKAFSAGSNAKEGKESFCILIPPPNVTGSLHMGHAFNNTLQDILVRWHRMRGFDTLWQPGQDHAGIATQMVVERDLLQSGKPGREELGRDRFLEKVWEWKKISGNTIIDQLKRLGASCDWDRNRFTMDPGFHNAVISVFVDLYKKGIIYKGRRLVNWDPHFETAISDLEVENIEVDGHFWHIKYYFSDSETYKYQEKDELGEVIFEEERNYISIATTRPETMFGDSAVAVHPKDERYKNVIGKKVILPLSKRTIPIIADEYADPKFGSGAVKITGAHDFNDYEVAKRHNLDLIVIMDKKGTFLEHDIIPERYQKIDRFEVRKLAIKDLKQEGLLIKTEEKKITQPFGDRSKAVIEPMLTDQWFVDTQKIVEPAINAVKTGETRIYPKQDEKVYFHWLENIEPWCISRQLWWGHQIPIWYDDDGNEYCAHNAEEAQKMAPGKNLERDPDVLDTWFSSGLWPIGTLGWPEKTKDLENYFPTTVLVTGFDIIFFWVARMMMMQLAVVNKVPFREVYVHALVRDEKGKKMSKSLGNVLDPLNLIDDYGADSVRFTLTSMAAMGRDLKLSVNRIEGYRNFGTKLWNAARFAEFHDCKSASKIKPNRIQNNVNKWIVGELVKTQLEIDKSLKSYRFNDAADHLYKFVWGKFCDWYVEFSKTLMKNNCNDLVNETKGTLLWIIENTLKLVHPFMPFITEELWREFNFSPKLLVTEDWPILDKNRLIFSEAAEDINWIINIVQSIRSLRSEMGIDPGVKIPVVLGSVKKEKLEKLEDWAPHVQSLARISSIAVTKSIPKGSVVVLVDSNEFYLVLSEVIDIALERSRLLKGLDKLQKERVACESKLQNEKFINNAPKNVVEENRSRTVKISEEIENIKGSILRLDQMTD